MRKNFICLPPASDKTPKETSESIEQQMENFLQSGGEIEQINSGISGIESIKNQLPKSMKRKKDKKKS